MSLLRYVIRDRKTSMYLQDTDGRLGAGWTEELERARLYESVPRVNDDLSKFAASRRFDLAPVPVRATLELYRE